MSQPVSDLTYLSHVTGGSTHLMCFFIKSYLSDAPGCLAALTKTSSQKDWPGLKKAAHTFKGHIKYMGLLEIIPLLQDVEDAAAAESNLDKVPEKVKRIVEVGNLAITELEATVKTLERSIAE